MAGMDRVTGRALGGEAHLRQSIRDILTTPVGTRWHRRDYGSRVPELLDSGDLVAIQAAAAEALATWEPRLELERVIARRSAGGQVIVDVEGRAGDGAVLLEGVL